MDHRHDDLILIIHPKHQDRYNQQLKEIFEIRKQMMLLVIVVVVDINIPMI
jgi:hypothetical protein